MRLYPRLTCEYLLTGVDIVRYVLSFRSTVDLTALRRLRVLRAPRLNIWTDPFHTGHHVVMATLRLCANLTQLCIYTEFLSAEHLDAMEEIGQLTTLEIVCPRLQKLGFLRHFSDSLEVLRLCCAALPPEEYAQLQQLGRLRKLWLQDCQAPGPEQRAALAARSWLEWLELDRAGLVPDPSSLAAEDPWLRIGRHLDVSLKGDVLTLQLRSVDIDAYVDKLSDALPLLEDLGVGGGLLGKLAGLHRCPELRELCVEFQKGPEHNDQSTVRVRVKLTSSE
ncbi:uncharacterized protein LOC126291874 [Schistocerca gregaria]|uniref:uncharacterized protein LOC126291874 n=1 Tax=Schistocerca gregaria TaxID=7010 RepID=UPI00211DE35A|nr:uncharacterized protein LOC126291874 [Schistocerca gregaria]